MQKIYWYLCGVILFALTWSCKQDTASSTNSSVEITNKQAVQIPSFSDDTAFAFVQTQVNFGPRNPNSAAAQACRSWIIKTLELYGIPVIEQPFEAKGYTGTLYQGVNIIGTFRPELNKRIMLSAHYDTRFMAEEDPETAKQNKPILGADDGASGVAVLLEIARSLAGTPPDLGVDFVFFDL